MTGQDFLHLLAEQFVSELQPNEAIRKFTTNSDVIGAYAEASLRQFVARVVAPLRVSTGAVVMDGNDFVNVPLISVDNGKVAVLGMKESHVPTQILVQT